MPDNFKARVVKSIPIARKDSKKRIVQGPIVLNGIPDYDNDKSNGEQIEDFMISYSTYGGVDRNHEEDGVGYTFSLYQTTEDTILEKDGEEIVYPAGSLWGGVKVEDDRTWQDIENGILTGFSPVYLPRTIKGFPLIDILEGTTDLTEEEIKEATNIQGTGPSGRVTLADLRREFGEIDMVSIGLVADPAVEQSFFAVKKNKGSIFDRLVKVFKNSKEEDFEEVVKALEEKIECESNKEGGEDMDEINEKLNQLISTVSALIEIIKPVEEVEEVVDEVEVEKSVEVEEPVPDTEEVEVEEPVTEEPVEEPVDEVDEVEVLKAKIAELEKAVSTKKSRGLKNGYEETESVVNEYQPKIQRDIHGCVIRK